MAAFFLPKPAECRTQRTAGDRRVSECMDSVCVCTAARGSYPVTAGRALVQDRVLWGQSDPCTDCVCDLDKP